MPTDNDKIKLNEYLQLFSQFTEGIVDAANVLKEQNKSDDDEPEVAVEIKDKMKRRDDLVDRLYDMFVNNGEDPKTGLQFSLKNVISTAKSGEAKLQNDFQQIIRKHNLANDAFASPDIMLVMPKVVQKIIQEPIQYNEQLSPLLRRIRVKGQQIAITFPALGAVGGQRLDMGEGGEYPELTFDMAGSTTVKVGKSGIAIRVTEETLRYSEFDVLGMLIREAGRALARWKDKKVADHVLRLGVTAMNNDDNGVTSTTGRDISGAHNGSLAVDDLFTVYTGLVNQGFTPDTLLLHPMAWLIFARDPQMRHLAWWNGGTYWGTPQGNLPYASQFETSLGGSKGAWAGSLGLGGESAIAGMYHPVFKSFPVPLRIVVSPTIPFTPASGSTPAKTDIIMCDSNELGMLLVDEEPTSDRWDDPSRDVYKVKIRERYAIGILNDGQAIRTIKNVRITKNYDFDERLTWQAGSGALPSGGFTV